MTWYAAVVGPGDEDAPELLALAEQVGRGLAEHGVIVVTGGLHGVMAAACRGASSAGGMTVGLLPGDDRAAGNQWLSVALPTGLGELRNGLVVRAADVVVAVGGSWGTLSEVALAMRTGTPVVILRPWHVDAADAPEPVEMQTAADAVPSLRWRPWVARPRVEGVSPEPARPTPATAPWTGATASNRRPGRPVPTPGGTRSRRRTRPCARRSDR